MEELFLIFSVINNDMMNSFVQSFLHPRVQFVLFPLDIMLHLHVLLFSSTNSESPSLTTVSERPEYLWIPLLFIIIACSVFPLKHQSSDKICIWWSTYFFLMVYIFFIAFFTSGGLWTPWIYRSCLFCRILFAKGLVPFAAYSRYLNTNWKNRLSMMAESRRFHENLS